MKVQPATSVALLIAAIAAMLSGCASQTNPTSTGGSGSPSATSGPGALTSMQQKQQAVENSNMSPQAKQAWEQAAAQAAANGPHIPKTQQ